jgi:hypothetical protein
MTQMNADNDDGVHLAFFVLPLGMPRLRAAVRDSAERRPDVDSR